QKKFRRHDACGRPARQAWVQQIISRREREEPARYGRFWPEWQGFVKHRALRRSAQTLLPLREKVSPRRGGGSSGASCHLFPRREKGSPCRTRGRGAEKHNFCEPALSGHAIFVSCRATWIESLTHVNVWVAHNFIVFPWSSRIVS